MKKFVEERVDEYLDYLYSIRGYSEKTIETYREALEKMLSLSTIYEDTRATLHIDIVAMRVDMASLSKRTVSKKLSALRSFVKWMNDIYGKKSLLEGDDSVRVAKTLPKPVESRYIFEALRNGDTMQRAIVALLYGLGLRIGELASLKLENITPRWITVTGKGGKTRQLPVPGELHTILESYIRAYRPRRYLFEKGGVPMNSAQLRYRVSKLFGSRGVKVTPHQLRHSYATHLLDNGARISDVSELLGHSNMATTQIYTKLGNRKKMSEYMSAHPLARQKKEADCSFQSDWDDIKS